MTKSNRRRKRALVGLYGWVCSYCGERLTDEDGFENTATVDHILPKGKGGTNEPENTCLACLKCNERKADMTVQEFGAIPIQIVMSFAYGSVKEPGPPTRPMYAKGLIDA